MNKKIHIDERVFLILYYRYKQYIVPLVTIFGCLLLFFVVIIPQIQVLFDMRDQENAYREKIKAMQQNVNFISNLDDTTLDTQFTAVASALPVEKDYAGVITAISRAAGSSGVAVGDFSFSVGDLSTPSAKTSQQPSIQIKLTVSGDTNKIRTFITTLSQRLPLSEEVSVKINGTTADIATSFYYKPPLSIPQDPSTVMQPLTKDKSDLLNTLVSWQSSQPPVFSTASAQPSTQSGQSASTSARSGL